MQFYSANYPESLLAVEQEMHFEIAQSIACILLTYFCTGRSRHWLFQCLMLPKGQITACQKTGPKKQKALSNWGLQLLTIAWDKSLYLLQGRKRGGKKQREAGIMALQYSCLGSQRLDGSLISPTPKQNQHMPLYLKLQKLITQHEGQNLRCFCDIWNCNFSPGGLGQNSYYTWQGCN